MVIMKISDNKENPGNSLTESGFAESISIQFNHLNKPKGPRMPIIFPQDLRMTSSVLLAKT